MAREFSVIIERDADYFVASVPALRGCHTQATSLDHRPWAPGGMGGGVVAGAIWVHPKLSALQPSIREVLQASEADSFAGLANRPLERTGSADRSTPLR